MSQSLITVLAFRLVERGRVLTAAGKSWHPCLSPDLLSIHSTTGYQLPLDSMERHLNGWRILRFVSSSVARGTSGCNQTREKVGSAGLHVDRTAARISFLSLRKNGYESLPISHERW